MAPCDFPHTRSSSSASFHGRNNRPSLPHHKVRDETRHRPCLTHQTDWRGFHHGVGRFQSRHQPNRLDKAESPVRRIL